MYQIGNLVEHKLSGTVGVIVNKSDTDKKYWVKFSPPTEPRLFTPDDIQPITFKQYAFYKDPNNGRMKIGRNSAFAVGISIASAIMIMAASFTVDGAAKLIPLSIGAGVIALNYIGLRYNYTRRWV